MQTKNIFNEKVSAFPCVTDPLPVGEITLRQAVNIQSIRDKVSAYRNTKDKAIKLQIPCFTASGVFSERRADKLVKHSGVIAIDIDKKDNIDVEGFDDLKQIIRQLPYVAHCGLSVGGEGYFLLIPIAYPDKHREHFEQLEADFSRCGLTIDKGCKDVSRLRIMSIDDEPYINESAQVYTRYKVHTPTQRKQVYSGRNDAELLVNEIIRRGIDITGDYRQWSEIGAAIGSEFGEAGRSYFHSISQFSPKYSHKDADKKYSDFMRMGRFSIETLFYYAKQYGILIKELRK